MRHFSGDFKGVRLLMLDELDAIAGGDGEDTDSPPAPDPEQPDIIVIGTRITSAPVPGFASPVTIDLPSDPSPQAQGAFNVGGGCNTSQGELSEALYNLSTGSAAARAIVDAARESSLTINLIREDTTSDRDGYSTNTHILSWDAFSATYGQNYDGSAYTESPTMSLAHELVHWANPNLTEVEVIAVTNEIAKQMNQSFGTDYETHRDNHTGLGRTNVNDTDNANASDRPACT